MIFANLLPESWKERLRRRAGAITLRARLEALRTAGLRPGKIIDAGAFRGDWTRQASEVFPDAEFLMIEPQPDLAAHLGAFCARRPRTRFRAAFLGSGPATVRFALAATNSRAVAPDYAPGPNERVIEIPVTTLAEIVHEENFDDCTLVKLDLQGHELEALAGAGALFGAAEAIIVETSWLRIGPVPLVHEVIAAFSARGYRLYDVLGFNYRPLDGALWQTDIVFVKEDSPLLASRDWARPA
jgi:FkbM family methyltransferase